jgi:activator of HSP90 ATPase
VWGGEIHGKNIEASENKKLVQEWFSGDWKKPSKVTFTLKEEKEKNVVDLLHEDVPDSEEADIAERWDIYYLGGIKKYLEKK